MKAMAFYGKIKDGIFRFTAEKIFSAYCRLQKDGDYTLTFSKTVAGKTNEQLAYFHAVVVPVIYKQIKDFYGLEHKEPTVCFMVKDKLKQIPMTEDNIVLMLKMIWAKQYNNGEVKSKADMSIEEASQLLDASIIWAEYYLGCQIPPPEKTLV